MDFTNYLIESLLLENNLKIKNKIEDYRKQFGFEEDPDDDSTSIKNTRFPFLYYMVQPPVNYRKLPEEERQKLYSTMKEFFGVLHSATDSIVRKGLGQVFAPRKEDGSKPVVRLIYDGSNEYAAMYQQEDDNNNGIWEHGDFVYNLKAKNANIHTLVHELGHKYYYEVLPTELAGKWAEYYKDRKFRDRSEFVSKYAMQNDREDFAETFAVYVLGNEKIDSLYEKRRTNKNPAIVNKILSRFKKIVVDDHTKILKKSLKGR